VPSPEDVIDVHCLVYGRLVSSNHVAPLLAEVQILPPMATAASFVPSPEDVIDVQLSTRT
jgi:hypothetical protein